MKSENFLDRLSDLEGKVAVVSLGNPDPDAIASAFALGKLLEFYGIDYDYLFESGIHRPENQLLVNYLGISIRQLERDSLENFDHVSLVDCNPSRLNPESDKDWTPDMTQKLFSIQDHHGIEEEDMEDLESRDVFVDVRPKLGSCATILGEVIQESKLEFDENTATALYYGLHSDTNGFLRGYTRFDFLQATNYVEKVDQEALTNIIGTVMTSETFDLIHRVTDQEFYEVRGTFKFADAGTLDSKSKTAIPQVADLLLREEGVEGVVIAGVDIEEQVIVGSVRYSGSRFTAEEIAEKIADGNGSGGGHVEMGGFQLQPGVVRDTLESRSTQNAIMDSIKERFFNVVGK